MALFAAAAALALLNFDIGFRTTADQIATTEFVATHSLAEILQNGIDNARAQGRIGWLIVRPLLSLGAHYGDFVLYPLIAVGVLMTIVWALFRWAELLAGGRIALPLMALYLALLPVGMHHWQPNAYAMQFVPLAAALTARNALLRRERPSWPVAGLLVLLVLAGALAYELSFALLLAMTLVEAAVLASGSRPQAAGGLSHGFVLRQAALLAAAVAAYLAFRLAFPSSYGGNQPAVLSQAGQAALTTLLHIVSASSLDIVAERLPRLDLRLRDLAAAALVGLGLAAAVSRLALPEKRRPALLAGASLAIVLAAAAPIGFTAKHIGWCLERGECRYLDSRLSLAGICIAVLAIGAAMPGRRMATALLVASVVVAGPLTYLVNVGERQRLDYGKRAENAAKAFVCANPDPAADPLPLARRLAEYPVSFHPHYTPERKVEYWTIYVGLLRANPTWRCPRA